MEQWFHRGKALTGKVKIKRMVSFSDKVQIYETNANRYVLVVKAEQAEEWAANYQVSISLFDFCDIDGIVYFVGENGYLISLLDKGPYPFDEEQVETFSIAFGQLRKKYPNASLENAVYIEELTSILPCDEVLSESSEENNIDIVYGSYLTGGVKVSAKERAKISKLIEWLPRTSLRKYLKHAGFIESNKENAEKNEEEFRKAEEKLLEEELSAEPSESIQAISDKKQNKFALIGRPELEAFFNDNIIDIVQNEKEYKRMGIDFPGATVLFGPPGCGKTYAVEQLAKFLDWPRYDINSSSVASPFIHDTAKKIAEVFDEAIECAPSILIIDELDAYLSNRTGLSGVSQHSVEEVAEFLRRIPEAVSKRVLIFGMTNMVDNIDKAVLRRGRFDYIVEVKPASAKEIQALLEHSVKKLPIHENVDLCHIAKKLEKHPLSDVAFLLREAGKIAVKSHKQFMDAQCFEEAFNMLPKDKDNKTIGFKG